MEKERFSYFLPPITNTTPEEIPLSLEELRGYISGEETLWVWRRGEEREKPINTGTLREVTERVRALSPEAYKRGKTNQLPLVTFGGIFSKRKGDGLETASGLVGLDIDHISQLQKRVSLETLKREISQDREIGVRLLFTSPSGDGLKIVCKTSGQITDRESYRREFETLNRFVSQKYSLPIGEIGLDSNISDITRGCLLCFDPGVILRTWEDSFHPEEHPLPEEVNPRPPRPQRERISGEEVSSWDWEDFADRRLIPALFDRVDSVFPEMSFKYNKQTQEWESPYKLDGSPAKSHRKEKTIIKADKPWGVLEQGGEAVRIIDYYMEKNSLQYGDALRELSRLCGLEEEYKDLSRRYAKMKEKETPTRGISSGKSTPEGGKTASFQAVEKPSTETPLEYSLEDFTEIKDLREIAESKREGIKTSYRFKDSQGREESLVLPSGALTLICGKSSHGKSRLLQNLSLQIAERERDKGEEGVVLYFSFEESLLEVVTRFANIAVSIPHLSQFETPNSEVFRDYFKTGKLSKSTERNRQTAIPLLSGFVDHIYQSGRLRIYYTPDLHSGGLCSLLEKLSKRWRIKAVFLDYVQAIYKEDYRGDRREELREICRDINKTAISLDIPIVLSAQLNRETPNPSDMSGDNIAESADITRYANTILLLWDSAKERDIRGGKSVYLNTPEGQILQAKGFTLGESGKLYAVISKNRGGTPDIETLLDYVPETGKVRDNEDLPEETSGSLDFNPEFD